MPESTQAVAVPVEPSVRPLRRGELWSWTRSVMCQGADIRVDYDMGNHKGYEAYSARLDSAAAEREHELTLGRLLPTLDDAVHAAVSRALDEAGVRNEVLRGMCLEVAHEKARECFVA